jgi:hypothetical protein
MHGIDARFVLFVSRTIFGQVIRAANIVDARAVMVSVESLMHHMHHQPHLHSTQFNAIASTPPFLPISISSKAHCNNLDRRYNGEPLGRSNSCV